MFFKLTGKALCKLHCLGHGFTPDEILSLHKINKKIKKKKEIKRGKCIHREKKAIKSEVNDQQGKQHAKT